MNLSEAIEYTVAKAEGGILDPGVFFGTLATGQPDLFTFLFDNDTRLLTEQEHDYLLFIAMIILEVCASCHIDVGEIRIDTLEEVAEQNWGLLEHASVESISESVSQHPAHEMYLFLEDACTPVQSHEMLTEVAAELVYVKCKTLVDSAFSQQDMSFQS